MSKLCKKCNTIKSLDGFSKCSSAKDGKQAWCSECHRNRNNNELNPDRHNRYNNKYPAPEKAVYAILNENKTIVYIGESERTSLRLIEHLENHTGRTSVGPHVKEGWSYAIVADCTSKTYQERMCLEKIFIYSLTPELNKEWKKKKK